MAIYDNRSLMMAAYLVVAVGALNWGLVEFLDFNLITDGLSLSKGQSGYQAVILIIGAAGALNLVELADEWT